MKNLITFLIALFLCPLLWAQNGSTLYQDDLVTERSGTMGFNPDWAPFYHGVASGDPLADRVIIWTRVTPGEMDNEPIEVQWRVATDVQLENVVQSGAFTTGPERDYTVKVDVTGLASNTTYYYGFSAMDRNSLTGRTKTTPTGDQAEHLKFGVVSCSNFQAGYFNAYQRLAERNDLDAIIHLGDYIYEQGSGQYGQLAGERPIEPEEELLSLEDYRARYSTYRLDTSLARVHQQHPFITVWDDHESANDSYTGGAENHQPETEGDWDARKATAKQVYFEWLPIRDTEDQSVFRKISYGNLMDLIMLDTRLEGREKQIFDINAPELQDTSRTLLGAEQKAWLFDQLSNSSAKWKVIGQQVIFSEFNIGWGALLDTTQTFAQAESVALDIWDGYPAERSQVIDFINTNQIGNTVILTGDFHTALAFDVTAQPVNLTISDIPDLGEVPVYLSSDNYDPATGEGAIGVEFACPSITSANFDENFNLELAQIAQLQINQPLQQGIFDLGNPNPHLKYADLIQNGYYILDVKADSVQADYFFSNILEVVEEETFGQAWYTRDGANHLVQAAAPSAPKAQQEEPAPANPPQNETTSVEDPQIEDAKFALLGVYPNPFQKLNTLHYSLNEAARMKVQLFDVTGKPVRTLLDQRVQPGIFSLELDASNLPEGAYFYQIRVDDRQYSAKVVVER